MPQVDCGSSRSSAHSAGRQHHPRSRPELRRHESARPHHTVAHPATLPRPGLDMDTAPSRWSCLCSKVFLHEIIDRLGCFRPMVLSLFPGLLVRVLEPGSEPVMGQVVKYDTRRGQWSTRTFAGVEMCVDESCSTRAGRGVGLRSGLNSDDRPTYHGIQSS